MYTKKGSYDIYAYLNISRRGSLNVFVPFTVNDTKIKVNAKDVFQENGIRYFRQGDWLSNISIEDMQKAEKLLSEELCDMAIAEYEYRKNLFKRQDEYSKKEGYMFKIIAEIGCIDERYKGHMFPDLLYYTESKYTVHCIKCNGSQDIIEGIFKIILDKFPSISVQTDYVDDMEVNLKNLIGVYENHIVKEIDISEDDMWGCVMYAAISKKVI